MLEPRKEGTTTKREGPSFHLMVRSLGASCGKDVSFRNKKDTRLSDMFDFDFDFDFERVEFVKSTRPSAAAAVNFLKSLQREREP